MSDTLKALRVTVPCTAAMLLAACGGGSSGSLPSVTTYSVGADAGTGGSISPPTAMVDAGGTTTLTVTPSSGHLISGVTGCGGTLSGNTYITGMIDADCTVTATFAAAFTWVGGASAVNANGVYGTEGMAAATNIPGARGGGRASAASWRDASGTVWMFGGSGYDSAGTDNFMNDLWKYLPSSGEWTWVGGSSVGGAMGVYGTRGKAAAANIPGARSGEVTWIDAGGDLWLFGGDGVDSTGATGYLNDLWEYSPASGEWVWINGGSTVAATGSYGTEGVVAAANVPGGRNSAVAWTDGNGNLWLFGGVGYDATGFNIALNDLWKYSPASGEWTWVGGSSSGGAKGVYGTQGVAAATNVPGARLAADAWTDASGNLWLFGGEGYDSTGAAATCCLNDLWQYAPSSGEWVWVSGSSSAGATGVYGTAGVAAATNVPGGRAAATGWTDAAGHFWLFGGGGVDSTGALDTLNDLWEYSPASGEWTWIGGSNALNASGVYGTQRVTAAANVPGARRGAVAWMDAGGDLWMFGGYGSDAGGSSGSLNDLWEYPTK